MAVKSWFYVRTTALPLRSAVCGRHSSSAAGKKDGRPCTPKFGDTREAYRSKSFSELLRHYVVFKAFSFRYLVDNNKRVSEMCTFCQASCLIAGLG